MFAQVGVLGWGTTGRLEMFGALAHNGDGSLELAGTDGAGGVWHTTQINGSWSSWSLLSSAKTLRHIAAETKVPSAVAQGW